ncbi:MAG: PH domain-containing protein [Thermoleophilaceae bacterium]
MGAGNPEPSTTGAPEQVTSAAGEPTQRLPAAARGLFVVQGLGGAAPLALIALIAGAALADAGTPVWIAVAVQALGVAGAVAAGIALPLVRWRRWRYELRDEELDLLRGAVVVTRTLIPTARVQHVDTRRTWLSDRFGLRAVIVHTAGGAHAIPALGADEAAAIRDRIATLARAPDDV